MTLAQVTASLCRMVEVRLPWEEDNSLGPCWACGMLLKNCGEDGLNPNYDPFGPFWTETYRRVNGKSPKLGKTFPALFAMNDTGNTGGLSVKVDESTKKAAACRYCALQFEFGKQRSI